MKHEAVADSDRLAYSIARCAVALDVSEGSVASEIRKGELLTFSIGSRVLISRESALAFVAKREAMRQQTQVAA